MIRTRIRYLKYMMYNLRQPISRTVLTISPEWVKVLKYGDLFNAVNRAEDAFTVLAPTNDAVLRFYEKKGVTSIEDLGYEYARTLVTYHVINDSIDREDFVKSGELPWQNTFGRCIESIFR